MAKKVRVLGGQWAKPENTLLAFVKDRSGSHDRRLPLSIAAKAEEELGLENRMISLDECLRRDHSSGY